MSPSISREQARDLFAIRRPDEVRSFLTALEVESSDSWKWLPLGGREANATNVELATEQAPPVIERITNGIDALVELAKADSELEPSSPREAAERWFGIPGGSLAGLDNGRDLVMELAPRVRVDVYESGVEKAPSIAVKDEGVGQHPFDLQGTILSLGASNKIGKHYLCGAYGHGGSSTFAWCEYSIIVSRCRPQHGEGKPDLAAWTVVRKYDDVDLKINTYQYLATADGKIPTCPPDFLDGTGFEFGTYIVHIAYELGRYSAIWSRVGFRFLNNLLFDPVLPFAVRDHREREPQDRYLRGNRARLREASIEYSSEYAVPLGEDGNLVIRYWAFRERQRADTADEESVKIDSYLESQNSSRTVAITLNGQRHSFIEKSIIKHGCQYPLLAESLLVQVDCDQLSRQRKKDLFPATRTGIRAGERRLELIERCLIDALASDTELKRLENERLERRLAKLDEKGEREVRRLLDRLIAVTRKVETEGAGQRGGVGTGPRRFKPKDPPTVFRFVDEGTPVRVEPGGLRVVDIRTDGSNDMLHRLKRRARLRLEAVGDVGILMRAGTLRDGRLSVTVAAKADAAVGSNGTLRAVLEMQPDVYLTTERPLVVVPPPPPYVGNEPPTAFEIGGKRIRLRKGRPVGVQIRTDCRDDILTRPREQARLQVACTIPGGEVTGRRGPRRGQIDVYLGTPDDAPLEAEGQVQAGLLLADGTTLEDTKPCVVLAPPARGSEPEARQRQEPNYEIIPVWKEEVEGRKGLTWDDPNLNWNETHVGKHDQSGDKLLLYVNMDHDELVKERVRRLSADGHAAADRVDLRYKAYIGYHLWLHFQRTREVWQIEHDSNPTEDQAESQNDDEGSDTDQGNVDDEMRRVAKTVLLAMRSERDLIRQLAQE